MQKEKRHRERTKSNRIKEDILKCGENEKGKIVNAVEFNGGPAVEITQSTVSVFSKHCSMEYRDTSEHLAARTFLFMCLLLLVSCRDVCQTCKYFIIIKYISAHFKKYI